MSLDVELLDSKTNILIFEANITHNLTRMANEAGIYMPIWHGCDEDENDEFTAGGIYEMAIDGVIDIAKNPTHYKQFDAENGWGVWEQFVPWLFKYMEACRHNPTAEVIISV